MPVVVSDARGAAAADAAAMESGVPSRALMQRAGAAAAAELANRLARRLSRGVVVATGAGNNGGDGWVVARALHAVGIAVRVVECAPARTADARAERELTLADGVPVEEGADRLSSGAEDIAVDALLGTGFTAGEPLRAGMDSAIAQLAGLSQRGAAIVALDVPSGLDATTGEARGNLHASLTLTFGTLKQGLLKARGRAGAIVLLDIGLGVAAGHAGAATLCTARWFRASLPVIPADAHKGTRKKIVLIGGAEGMAGAVVLAARAALRSGAGLVRCVVAPGSLLAVQRGEPAALAATWPDSDEGWRELLEGWADAVLIGPGLGKNGARQHVESVLKSYSGPLVLDADALNAFAGEAAALGSLIGAREALLTPHPLEFERLTAKRMSQAELCAGHRRHRAAQGRAHGARVAAGGNPLRCRGHADPCHRWFGRRAQWNCHDFDGADRRGDDGRRTRRICAWTGSRVDLTRPGARLHNRGRDHRAPRRLEPHARGPSAAGARGAAVNRGLPVITSANTPMGDGAEFDAIRSLLDIWGANARGIGDDAAIVDIPAGERLVVSTDASFEGVHFRREWMTGRQIGARGATAALSDLAAMGSAPRGLLLSLGLPASWHAALRDIGLGVGESARAAGCPIIGGNLSSASELSLTFTVLGSTATPLVRSGALPGDIIFVTGRLGGPGAAIRAWLAGGEPEDAHRARVITPVARIAEDNGLPNAARERRWTFPTACSRTRRTSLAPAASRSRSTVSPFRGWTASPRPKRSRAARSTSSSLRSAPVRNRPPESSPGCSECRSRASDAPWLAENAPW